MVWSVTNIGTGTTGSGGSQTLTLPSAGVPVNAIVCVAYTEGSTWAAGQTLTDTKGNAYTQITHGITGGSWASFWYGLVTIATVSGNTLSMSRINSGANSAMSAFYVTGSSSANPFDRGVVNTNSGTGTAPSVVSGTPGQSGEFFVGFMTWASSSATFANGSGWSTPFNSIGAGSGPGFSVGGGNQTNAGSAALTFSGTLSASAAWFNCVVGFVVSGTVPVLWSTGAALAGSGALAADAQAIQANPPAQSLGSGASGSSPFTWTGSAAIQTGDTVVIAVASGGGAGAPQASAVSDGVNSYTLAGRKTTGTYDFEIWYKVNAAAVPSPSFSVSWVNFNAASVGIAARVASTYSVKDVGAIFSAFVSGAAVPSVSTGALANSKEIVFGIADVLGGSASNTWAASSGFTDCVSASNGGVSSLDLQFRNVNATASVTFQPSATAGGGTINNCCSAVVTFASPIPPRRLDLMPCF